MAPTARPLEIALLDDYAVVLAGLSRMLDPYADRVRVVEIDVRRPPSRPVDIALYDTFAQGEADQEQFAAMVRTPHAQCVVIYTWNFHPDLIATAHARGIRGYLSKTLPARDLVEALEAVHAGHEVVSSHAPRAHVNPGLDWPGRHEGLTDREAEVLALITQGRSNAEIAAVTYLSPNTIKSYIRGLYRKIAVSSRTQAVLWGVANGFTPDQQRVADWTEPVDDSRNP